MSDTLPFDALDTVPPPGGSPQGPSPTPAPAPTQDQSIPFDALDTIKPESAKPADAPETSTQAPDQGSGVAANLGAGLVGDVTGLGGSALDLLNSGVNLGIRGVNALAGTNIPQIPMGAAQTLNSIAGGTIGLNPDEIKAVTPAEYAARGIGAALPFAVAGPEGMALRTLAGVATSGALSGLGQFAGEKLAPPGYEDIGGLAGSMIGGLAPVGLEAAASKAIPAARNIADQAFPLTRGMQVRAANAQLERNATDIGAVDQAMGVGQPTPPPSPEIVPGSQPTLAQASGDIGLANMEANLFRANPELQARYLDRLQAQTAARAEAVAGLSDPTTDPQAVGDYVRSRLAQMNADEATGMAAARQSLSDALNDMGGTETPDVYGRDWRSQLQDELDRRKAADSRLWSALDETNPVANIAPLRQTALANLRQVRENAVSGIAPEETRLYQRVAGWNNPNVPYAQIKALRTDTNDAINSVGGWTPAGRRLLQFRASLDDAIATAATRQVQEEALAKAASGPNAAESGNVATPLSDAVQSDAAVWATAPQNQEAISSELSQPDLAAKLQALVDEWKRNRNSPTAGRSAAGPEAGVYLRPTSGEVAPERATGVYPSDGTQVPSDRAPGLSAGTEGVQETTRPVTPWSDEHTAQYLAARAAWAETQRLWKDSALGSVLKRGPGGEYALADEQVPSRIWNGGATAMQDAQDLVNAVGHDRALALVQEPAMATLRQMAVKPDGTFSQTGYQNWLRRYDRPLTIFPELRAIADTPARAQAALDATEAAHAQARKAFEQSTARFFLNNEEPIDAVAAALRGSDRGKTNQNLIELAKMAAADPAAQAGLKRAVSDYIADRFLAKTVRGEQEVATVNGTALEKFIKDNGRGLRAVIGDDGVQTLKNVVRDWRRSQITSSGRKLPGGSDTAQNLAGKNAGESDSLWSHMLHDISHGAGLLAALEEFGLKGAAAAFLIKALRARGITQTKELLAEAMLDPEKYRLLRQQAPKGVPAQKAYARKLARAFAVSAELNSEQ